MSIQRAKRGRGRLWSALAACCAVSMAAPVLAQQEPVALTEENRLPEWCGVRPAMNVVIGYDEGKRFFLVEEKARNATQALLDELCPGDKVQLASFGLDVTFLGETVTMDRAEAAPRIMETLKKRGATLAPASINENLVKKSLEHWDKQAAEGELPVLVVFTDTLDSSAPRRVGTNDFPWTALPDYFQGRFLTLVGLMDHRAPRDVAALYTTTAPKDMAIEDFPVNPRASWGDVMRTFMPEPEPVVLAPREIIRTVEVTRNPEWLTWLSTPEGSLAAGGTVFSILSLIFLAGRLSRRRREENASGLPLSLEGKHPEVTLQLRDRLTNEVLRQETRILRDPLRVAPSSDADFVVPGPYAFEVLDAGGETPLVRSANMLGVEIQRGSRRLVVPEGETLAVRAGDRVDIGAGHEVEIQI